MLHYIGFAFWDILTFTLPEWRDIGEHGEIHRPHKPGRRRFAPSRNSKFDLEGRGVKTFCGSLSRLLRESDYLWGRLDGADRLIHIIWDAASADSSLDDADIKRIKSMAFRSILDAEEKFIGDKELVSAIRTKIDQE